MKPEMLIMLFNTVAFGQRRRECCVSDKILDQFLLVMCFYPGLAKKYVRKTDSWILGRPKLVLGQINPNRMANLVCAPELNPNPKRTFVWQTRLPTLLEWGSDLGPWSILGPSLDGPSDVSPSLGVSQARACVGTDTDQQVETA